MHDHLRCTDILADFQTLEITLTHDITNVFIRVRHIEPPERAMNAKTALITIQQRLDTVCWQFPITLQQADIKEILNFQIAIFRKDKVEMVFEI
ncbi:hypothetical protein D3C81_2152220 [compost metagenome]